MRIAFVAGGSVKDRRAWSGPIHDAHRALAKRFDVLAIETPRTTRLFDHLRHRVRRTGFDNHRKQVFTDVLARHTARRVGQADGARVFVPPEGEAEARHVTWP